MVRIVQLDIKSIGGREQFLQSDLGSSEQMGLLQQSTEVSLHETSNRQTDLINGRQLAC